MSESARRYRRGYFRRSISPRWPQRVWIRMRTGLACVLSILRLGSFYLLIDARKKRPRNHKPKRLCGLEIDDQFEFSRLEHRQIDGLLTLEDASDVTAGLSKMPRIDRTITH